MLKRQGRGKNLDPKLGRQVAHFKSLSSKTELGVPDGDEVFSLLWEVGARHRLLWVRREAPLSQSSPLACLKCRDAGVFSNVPSLRVHTEVSQPCLLFPPQPASCRPREFTLEARVVTRGPTAGWLCGAAARGQALLVPHAGLCPPPSGSAATQVPWEPLLWQIPFGFTGPRGGGRGGPLAGPTSLPRSEQFTNRSRREPEPEPGPNRLLLLPALSAGIRRFSPQLTCLRVARCEKLETKMVSPDGGGAFLYRKEGNTSVGFYFFSPPSSSKKYKETLSLMRMSALNLLGLD